MGNHISELTTLLTQCVVDTVHKSDHEPGLATSKRFVADDPFEHPCHKEYCYLGCKSCTTEQGGSVVTHETRIQEVPGSNPGAVQPDWGFFVVFLSHQGECWVGFSTIHLTIIHQIHISHYLSLTSPFQVPLRDPRRPGLTEPRPVGGEN